MWLSPTEQEFQNKGAFESQHGMQRFFDGDFFRGRGISQVVGEWGLANLQLSDGGKGYKLADGDPIPDSWRKPRPS